MPTFNDLKLENWKDSEIITDSLWLIPSRDNAGKHSGFYHGNFVPQIPRQLILRYSKEGDIVFDPFIGSGTTAFEAESLKRNFIGVDIQEDLVSQVGAKIDSTNDFCHLISGDSTKSEVFNQVKFKL